MKEILKISKKININLENCTKETVRIMAVNKVYKVKPYMPTAVYDTTKRKFITGVVELSDAQAAKIKNDHGIVFDKNCNIVYNNMDVLTLYKDEAGAYIFDYDFAKYNFLLSQPEVAASNSEVIPGTTIMYVDNYEREASNEVSKEKTKFKAMQKLMECTAQDWADILFFFGSNPINMSATLVEKNALALKDTRPLEVIAYFDKKEQSDKVVFVNKLLANKLLDKDVHDVIMYDGQALGVGAVAAAAYLYDEANDRMFSALKQALEATKGI